MFLPYLLTVSLVAFPLVAHAQSLLDALRLADAPAFAEYIGANPALLAQLSDPAVKTIFAPNDKAMEIFLSNGTINKRLLARQSPNNDRKTAQQSSNEAQAAAGLKTPPGRVVQTNHPGPGGKVVGQPGSNTGNSTGGVARRQQSTGPQAIIFSGLGNNVTIVKEDTPFYNGLIQTTDGFFTDAESFASTLNKTGSTSLMAGLQHANLSSILESPAGVTLFSLGDDAYKSATSNMTGSTQLQDYLSGYIVPNFLGYLPSLKDGDKLTTLAGTTLTVQIKDGEWYIGGARVISPNQITSTGVSHVLEKG